MPDLPRFDWRALECADIRQYRLARFGEAGRCGREGVARAAATHGVGIRAWYQYERGARRPPEPELRRIAVWLTRAARRIVREFDAARNGSAVAPDAPLTVDPGPERPEASPDPPAAP